jgi:hypothetical protein
MHCMVLKLVWTIRGHGNNFYRPNSINYVL